MVYLVKRCLRRYCRPDLVFCRLIGNTWRGVMDSGRQNPNKEILAECVIIVATFPKGVRELWVSKAVDRTPNLAIIFNGPQNLAAWLAPLGYAHSQPLRDVVVLDATSRHRPILEQFRDQLHYFCSCRRKCTAITRLFMRWPHNPILSPADGLAEAIAEHPRFRELARHDQRVIVWMKEAFSKERPHPLDNVVPPLTLKDLEQFQRAVDKHRKRAERDPRPLSLDAALLLSAGIVGARFPHSDSEFNEDEIELARDGFADLDEIDQQIWVLWSSGKKLREIGKLVGLAASSSVAAHLAKAVDAVGRFVAKPRSRSS